LYVFGVLVRCVTAAFVSFVAWFGVSICGRTLVPPPTLLPRLLDVNTTFCCVVCPCGLVSEVSSRVVPFSPELWCRFLRRILKSSRTLAFISQTSAARIRSRPQFCFLSSYAVERFPSPLPSQGFESHVPPTTPFPLTSPASSRSPSALLVLLRGPIFFPPLSQIQHPDFLPFFPILFVIRGGDTAGHFQDSSFNWFALALLLRFVFETE